MKYVRVSHYALGTPCTGSVLSSEVLPANGVCTRIPGDGNVGKRYANVTINEAGQVSVEWYSDSACTQNGCVGGVNTINVCSSNLCGVGPTISTIAVTSEPKTERACKALNGAVIGNTCYWQQYKSNQKGNVAADSWCPAGSKSQNGATPDSPAAMAFVKDSFCTTLPSKRTGIMRTGFWGDFARLPTLDQYYVKKIHGGGLYITNFLKKHHLIGRNGPILFAKNWSYADLFVVSGTPYGKLEYKDTGIAVNLICCDSTVV